MKKYAALFIVSWFLLLGCTSTILDKKLTPYDVKNYVYKVGNLYFKDSAGNFNSTTILGCATSGNIAYFIEHQESALVIWKVEYLVAGSVWSSTTTGVAG